MVNRALQGLICDSHGAATWRQIREKAGFKDEYFVSMNKYPDSLTYQLVEASSEVLDKEPELLLREFGQYWTLFVGKEGYGDLFESAGGNLVDFLQNLDHMHARVGLNFPELEPPSFRCSEVSGDSLKLHYHSKRVGLAPFVIGLIEGLGKHFGTPVEVEIDEAVSLPGHQQFHIRLLPC